MLIVFSIFFLNLAPNALLLLLFLPIIPLQVEDISVYLRYGGASRMTSSATAGRIFVRLRWAYHLYSSCRSIIINVGLTAAGRWPAVFRACQ